MLVRNNMVQRDVGWHWSWGWHRDPRGRALSEVEELEGLVQNLSFERIEQDKWIWLLNEDMIFSVKGLKELIDKQSLRQPGHKVETRWDKLVPRKVCIFV